jgi:hypothetical protein
MGAAVCLQGPVTTTRREPLQLRYLLHAHRASVNFERAEQVFQDFARSKRYEVVRATVKNQQYAIRRAGDGK